MGFDEASAYSQLEVKLEAAIVGGLLEPGSSGWRTLAASLIEEALHEPAVHGGRQSWLEMILAERQKTWVEMAHPEALRHRRGARVDD
jgi:hypothetical protein